jgi:hypothetical protein
MARWKYAVAASENVGRNRNMQPDKMGLNW